MARSETQLSRNGLRLCCPSQLPECRTSHRDGAQHRWRVLGHVRKRVPPLGREERVITRKKGRGQERLRLKFLFAINYE